MKRGKHIVLGSILIIFSIITVCINWFFKNSAGEGRSQAGSLSGICINEVCSSYFPTSLSETQPPSDWIELYNFSDTNINLGEYCLSDDKDDLDKCSLPPVELSPGDYYVIHSKCDEMAEEEAYLNFRVSAKGETLYLSSRAGGVIDAVDVPAMDTNTTWSRLPDAGNAWGNTDQTYQASNTQEELVQESVEKPVFSAEGGFMQMRLNWN
ncbi:MAG: lamin tail domain-containing protein [Lachnospiraceae bacterium]|nr:lamin tail domain-containing protein [Lachnospiraceae bacterium]